MTMMMTDVASDTDTLVPTNLDAVKRDSLVDGRGVRYKEFKASLKPRYGLLWTHLLLGHLVLLLIAGGIVVVEREASQFAPLAALVGALLFGYVIAYIQLFFHEAAHYNIAKDRAKNDRLANIFIGAIVGQDIKAYRPIHFDHHRHLGTPDDTERTYFDPLNMRFIVESLTGIKPVKVLAGRQKAAQATPKNGAEKKEGPKGVLNAQLVTGMLVNAAIVIGAVVAGYWWLAAAWVLGMIIFYPFLAAVRQLLEHRGDYARKEIDYSKVPHGSVNRMFGDGPVASTLGGAGFNRHLLHHWEPQISYTRLPDLEDFLMETEAADLVRSHRTTYFRTFVRLFNI